MQRRSLLATLAAATLASPLASPSASPSASPLVSPSARAAAGTITARDGTRLACLDQGAGTPVVLVHGWTLASEIWTLQTDWLANRGMRVVAYDRRGHGASDKPADGYDYDTLSADLAAVLDRLDLRDVTLVGHSMGAGEVARYLAHYGGSRIARVMLVAPTTPFALKRADNPDGIDRAVYDRMIAALEADPLAYFIAGMPGFLGRNVEPEMADWGLSIARQASVPALVKCIRAFSETDFRADMAAFTMPTLIVYGTGDVPSIIASSRRTATAIAGSRLQTYEGAPHGLFLTDAARFNQDLLAFARG